MGAVSAASVPRPRCMWKHNRVAGVVWVWVCVQDGCAVTAAASGIGYWVALSVCMCRRLQDSSREGTDYEGA